tara:strand:+ start:477 stop:653 length:177 start_codon:yes stop_codon:yes gene_type:complete
MANPKRRRLRKLARLGKLQENTSAEQVVVEEVVPEVVEEVVEVAEVVEEAPKKKTTKK